MAQNFDLELDVIGKEDPFFSEDEEITLNSLTDLGNVLNFFNSVHPKMETKTLEEQIHKQIKQNYFLNKYKLLALNNLPNETT